VNYVYRTIDQFGQVIDVFVSPRRDVKAARRFLEQAINVTKVAPVEGHCCICAGGVTDEYLSGGCFHSEGHENSSRGRSWIPCNAFWPPSGGCRGG
jgi:IS6 family transposase